MKHTRFAHLIQEAAKKDHLTTQRLGRRVGLTTWSARTLRWGDRMYISENLLERCIKRLGLPPRKAKALADRQNVFFYKTIVHRLRKAA